MTNEKNKQDNRVKNKVLNFNGTNTFLVLLNSLLFNNPRWISCLSFLKNIKILYKKYNVFQFSML